MTPSTRILVNTLATYGRNLFNLVVVLFTSRWVLEALGKIDFGLFATIGSVLTAVAFLNTVMSTSVVRHLSYAMGTAEKKNDQKEVKRWFNSALAIHVVLPAVLFSIGYPFAIWIIHHMLVIPPERLDACVWVFRISLITLFFNIVFVPFSSVYIAKQRIYELSIWSIVSTSYHFVCAYILLSTPHDKLLFYATYQMVGSVLILFCQGVRAFFLFPECRIDFSEWWDSKRLRSIFSFTGANLFGAFSAMFRVQGTNLVINRFFGPALNASYGVANGMASQANSLSSSLMGAILPEITTSTGRGEHERVLKLSLMSSKFTTLLSLFFVIPLMIECENVLIIWLKNPPEYSAAFCRWILLTLLVDYVTLGSAAAVNANGKIAFYHLVLGVLNGLSVPLVYLFFVLGFSPVSASVALLISAVLFMSGRVIFAQRLLGHSIGLYLRRVLLPIVSIFCCSYLGGQVFAWHLPPCNLIIRVLLVSGACFILTLCMGIAFLNQEEREWFYQRIDKNKHMKKRIGQFNFLLRSFGYFLLIPIIVLFPRNKKKIVFGAWSGKLFSDNPLYFYLFCEKYTDFKLVWVGQASISPFISETCVFAEKGTLKAFYHCLTAATYIYNVDYRHDILDFPICRKKVLINLWHGIPLKKIGSEQFSRIREESAVTQKNGLGCFLRKACTSFYDYLYKKEAITSVSSEDMYHAFRDGFTGWINPDILRAGTPRNEFLIRHKNDTEFLANLRQKYAAILGLPLNKKWFLYLPTFRYLTNDFFTFSSLSENPHFQAIMNQQNAIILEKQHLQILERLRLNFSKETENHPVYCISENKAPLVEIQELLLISDRLITDYSSCFFDFSLLDRPVIHFAYDYTTYSTLDTGLRFELAHVCAGPICPTQTTLLEALELSDDALLQMRAPALKQCTEYETGDTCRLVYGRLLRELKV